MNLYNAMNAVWRSQIRPFEPAMFHKQHVSTLGKKGNKAYSDSRQEVHARWQQRADELNASHNGLWSKRRIAGQIAEEENEKMDTVRINIDI